MKNKFKIGDWVCFSPEPRFVGKIVSIKGFTDNERYYNIDFIGIGVVPYSPECINSISDEEAMLAVLCGRQDSDKEW